MFKSRHKKAHKRSGSTPNSPDPSSQLSPMGSTLHQPPNSAHSYRPTLSSDPDDSANFFFFSRVPDALEPSVNSNPSPISPFPPSLPPIPRVASVRIARDQENIHGEHDGPGRHTRDGSADSRLRPAISNRSEPELEGMTEGHTFDFRSAGSRPIRSADGRASPVVSRPPTAGSGHYGYSQRSEVNSSSSSAQMAGVKSPPIYLNGPAYAQESSSSSKFPSESHRPPPKPPHAPIHSFSRPLLSSSATAPLPKQSKTKLNLLNPMSLLLRRRSGQTLEHLSDDALISHRSLNTTATLPDGYDPSIRGVGVHDFSAPRQRRNFSASSLKDLPRTPQSREEFSPKDEYRQEREHTPVFKEHFDDDLDLPSNNSAIRAETLANKDFIARNTGTPPMPSAPPPLPPYARTANPLPGPPVPPKQIEISPGQDTTLLAPLPVALVPLSPVMEDDSSVPNNRESDTNSMKRTANSFSNSRLSTASRGSRSSVGTDNSFRISGIPTHMTSNSSRFSFQLAGKDSAAQEQLLEERHKQKEAAKALAEKSRQAEEGESEEEEDDFDYDDMEGGLEEDVPTFGEDWDYASGGVSNMSIGGMDLGNVSVPNVGMLALRGNPVTPGSLTHPIPPVQGLGILPIDNEEAYSLPPDSTPGLHQPQQILGQRPSVPKTVDEMDDDFYFDDGLIDEVNSDDNEEKFDESVLDDPTHPLYERKPKRFSLSDNPVPARTNSATLEQPRSSLVSKSSHLDGERTVYVASAPYPGPSANAEALDTFHSILAMAATKAAENGRFQRHDSFGADAAEKSSSLANLNDEGPQEQSSSRPSLVPDESRTSQATTMSPLQGSHMDDSNEAKALAKDQKVSGFSLPSDYHEDYMAYASDFSDYDSMLEEDPIIAAANAEALANDDDGFYGSEFGFYAKPGENDTSETDQGVFFQGGYFGPKEWSDIKRQRSTREPNLTPITERSEYSTRNSFVSIPTGDRDRARDSPGLAALARMSTGWDSDMNMEALRRLRKGAFGGSQGSFGSFSSDRDQPSSPLASSPNLPKLDHSRLWNRSVDHDSDILPGSPSALETGTQQDFLEFLGADPVEWDELSSASSTVSDDGALDPSYGIPISPIMEDITPHSAESPRKTSKSSIFHQPLRPNPLPNFVFPQSKPQLSAQPQADFTSKSTTSVVNLPVPTQHNKAASGTFYSPASPLSPVKPPHSRTGSDSVAYVRERDEENGEYRWVLERRRMGENGVEEFVERTLVEGGMI